MNRMHYISILLLFVLSCTYDLENVGNNDNPNHNNNIFSFNCGEESQAQDTSMVLKMGIDGVDSMMQVRLNTPRYGTTQEMKQTYCIARQQMMIILQDEFSLLSSTLSPKDKSTLMAAQKAWERFFVNQQAFFTSVMEDYPAFRDYGLGTMHGTMKEQWLYEMLKGQCLYYHNLNQMIYVEE